MLQLLRFIYGIRVFAVFIILEIWALLLIRNSSPYYSAQFFSSSNQLAASILDTKSEVLSYFALDEEVEQLRKENAALHTQKYNSTSSYKYAKRSFKNKFNVQGSKVVNNSITFSRNYLTIDIGKKEGVTTGMGVIGDHGIIGRVKAVSQNYATVTSILHTEMLTSVIVGKERDIATLAWDGESPITCSLKFLPKHVKVSVGDSVFTSGYSGIFPEEILVGIVSNLETQGHESFHEVKVRLVNDFSKVQSAYVVVNKNLEERKILEEGIEQ